MEMKTRRVKTADPFKHYLDISEARQVWGEYFPVLVDLGVLPLAENIRKLCNDSTSLDVKLSSFVDTIVGPQLQLGEKYLESSTPELGRLSSYDPDSGSDNGFLHDGIRALEER